MGEGREMEVGGRELGWVGVLCEDSRLMGGC